MFGFSVAARHPEPCATSKMPCFAPPDCRSIVQQIELPSGRCDTLSIGVVLAAAVLKTNARTTHTLFRMIAFMASDGKVCLRHRSGKQYSLQRAVVQLGRTLEWG